MKEDKTQRIRRTRNELKEATLRAVSELSKEKGLSRITMVDIGEKAGIRVDVLKRNYTSVEKILSLYAASVDYWISDLFTPKHPMATINEKVMAEVFTNLANALYNDSEMQNCFFGNCPKIILLLVGWQPTGNYSMLMYLPATMICLRIQGFTSILFRH